MTEVFQNPVALVPRVALAGLRPSPSWLTVGILGGLRKRQISVGILKLGAALEQLAHYRRLAGRLCFSHHPWNRSLLSETGSVLARASAGAEFLLIEADQGMYDLYPEGYGVYRTQEMLAELETPVVVVVDSEDLNEGVAAIVKGIASFDSRSFVCGVILINASSETNRAKQERALIQFEEETGIVCLGVVPKSGEKLLDFSASDGVSRTRIISSVELTERFVNLDKLQSIARAAPGFVVPKETLSAKSKVCRIGVADDAVFNTMFQENLDLLRKEGADLVPFSVLSDSHLPKDVRGIYFPTGSIERYAAELQENHSMVDEIRNFAQSGGAIYAEGAAIAYLAKELTVSGGKSYKFTGVIPLHATFVERFSEPDFRVIECRAKLRSRFLSAGSRVRGVQCDRFALRLETALPVSVEGYSLAQVVGEPDCLVEHPPTVGALIPREKVFASQFLLNWLTCPQLAENFMSAAKQ